MWFLCNAIDDWKVWLMDEKWTLNDKVTELCVSKFYLVYMICISSCLISLLVRNVRTHSPVLFVFGSYDDLELCVQGTDD